MSTLKSYFHSVQENQRMLSDRYIIASERPPEQWVRSYRFDPGAELSFSGTRDRTVGYELTKQKIEWDPAARKPVQKMIPLDGQTRHFPYHADGPTASMILLDYHINANTKPAVVSQLEGDARASLTSEAQGVRSQVPNPPCRARGSTNTKSRRHSVSPSTLKSLRRGPGVPKRAPHIHRP